MTHLIVEMRLPPTLNDMLDAATVAHKTRSGRIFYRGFSELKKEWGNAIVSALLDCIAVDSNPWTECWVSVLYRVPFGNDPDNLAACQKFVMDALTPKSGIGLIAKDSLMVVQSPVVHQFEKASKADEKVIFTFSDRPIWKLEKLDCDKVHYADLQLPGNDILPRRKRARFKSKRSA